MTEIKQKIKGNYIILPFQNGIYAEEKIKKLFRSENTFGAVAQISAHIDEKQTIQHIGKLATFLLEIIMETEVIFLKIFVKKFRKIIFLLFIKITLKRKFGRSLFFCLPTVA